MDVCTPIGPGRTLVLPCEQGINETEPLVLKHRIRAFETDV